MADPYTNVSVVNFNTSPPPDDGSQTAANEITWQKHLDKLAQPLKTAIEAIDTNIDAAFAKIVGGGGVTTYGTTTTILTSDQGKLVRASNSGITLTTPDAASVGSPFVFAVLNDGGGDITLAGNGAQTINGEASLTLGDRHGALVFTDGSNWFAAGDKINAAQVGYDNATSSLTATNVKAAVDELQAEKGMDIIESGALSAASSLDITDLSANYRSYIIEFDDLAPADDNVSLLLRTSSDNGTTFDSGASDYSWAIATGVTGDNDTADTAIRLATATVLQLGNAAGEVASGRITIHNPMDSGGNTQIDMVGTVTTSDGVPTINQASGHRATAEANDAIRILMGSGSNIATMNYTLYGLRVS